MYKFYPYFTNDQSLGLYSPIFEDIYHSTYGALTEAYEKFILPADFEIFFKFNSEIKILDICFGIGYNSKSFLNYFLENIFKNKKNFYRKNHYNETIYTDNIFIKVEDQKNNKINIYNGKLYTDKILDKNTNKIEKFKIYIKAIDTDKNLIYLSPFFRKSGKNKKMLFENEKIKRFQKNKSKQLFKIRDEINIIILKKLIANFDDYLKDEELEKILREKKYKPFFDKNMINLYKHEQNIRYNKTYLGRLSTFLHNIYYRYVSSRNKKAVNALEFNDINIDFKCEDARKAIIADNNLYNFIFLDAFTPTKCPCLWSLDFFSELFKHLDDNGIILTYSSSANIRNAFLKAGFYIGKIYSQISGKFFGTIAVKNKLLIKHELSEFEVGLFNTKAGIIYSDKNLEASNEDILNLHNLELTKSNLISSTQYITAYRKEHNK